MINIPVKETYTTGKRAIKDVVGFVSNPFGKLRRTNSGKKKRAEKVLSKQKGVGIWTTHHGRTQEKKYKELTFNTYADDTIHTMLINGVEEGTGFNQRIGRKIDMSTCSFHINVISPTDFSSVKLRIMLVYDAQPNEDIFTLAELLQTATYPVDSYLNLENRDRFNILEDKIMMLNPVDSAKTKKTYIQFGKALSKYKVTYSDTGATVANISTGSLHLLVLSSALNGGAQSTKPQVDVIGRFRYFD